ncbi:MAG: FtsX-like permease family protein [Betaproteobacteria bacterium]
MSSLAWLLWHVVAGYARQHKLRAGVGVLAIAVGVALGYAVHLINTAALAEFSAAVRSVTGQADATVSGARTGFDEALFARVAARPEVELASPLLEVEVPVIGSGEARPPVLTVIGVDAFRTAALAPALIGRPHEEAAGRFALLDDGVFLSPAALRRFGVAQGDALRVQVGARTVELPIVGTLPNAREGQLLAVMDLGFAQWRLDRLGRLTRIELKLRPRTTAESLAPQLELPAGISLVSADAETTRVSNLSRAYRVNLNVLALVALFTGAFLVFSLQAQAMLARRTQLAYLRVAGVTRGQLQRLLVGEAVLTGALGAALGVALGAAVAAAALQLLGGDLGRGFFSGTRPPLQIEPLPLAGFALLGIGAAVVGSWLPARDAAMTPPALALKPGTEEDAFKPLGAPWPGLTLLAAAALLLTAPPWNGIPVGGYLAIAALLIGATALQPRLALAASAPLARRADATARAPLAWLALARVAQAPSFAAIGMAGIVASFALMIAMATMVASFRTSVDQWLERVLPADLYVRVALASTAATLSPADLQRLREHPAVARAEFSRYARIVLDPARAQVVLVARPFTAADPGRELPLLGPARLPAADAPPPSWITEAVVEIYGWQVGQVVSLPLAGQAHPFTVAGVWRDYARQFGAIALRLADYQRASGDTTLTDAALWLVPGARAAPVAAELRAQLDAAATTEFLEPGEIRQISLQVFDRSFAVTYVLQVAAIVIGLVGIAATFSAQAIARRREFGMLRHLGLTRGQVLRLLALEGLWITLLALGTGLATGLAVALVLVEVVNPQSFYWTMDFRVPVATVAVLMAALLAAATATAVLAGRRAISGDAVQAVREDW